MQSLECVLWTAKCVGIQSVRGMALSPCTTSARIFARCHCLTQHRQSDSQKTKQRSTATKNANHLSWKPLARTNKDPSVRIREKSRKICPNTASQRPWTFDRGKKRENAKKTEHTETTVPDCASFVGLVSFFSIAQHDAKARAATCRHYE